MNKSHSLHVEHLHLAAAVADLKQAHYNTLLSLSALIEVCIDKGLVTRGELAQKAASLDGELEHLLSRSAAILRPMLSPDHNTCP